ncbi:MAG: deoxyribonuclease IV [Candidatus Omnitrophica bacterium]|nr:deoxyribonuclease IV [Candidatus Omnitrophota bacterium]
MKVGAHLWIGEGFLKVIEYSDYLKCDCFQIFLSNPRSWKRKKRSIEEIENFKKEIKNRKIAPVVVHMPYILNIAEDNKILRRKIIKFIENEIEESKKIGAHFYVIHPGFLKGMEEKKGIKNTTEVLKNFKNIELTILLENTSGQGTSLGYSFKQMGYILSGLEENFGICFDTAHAFQAGYNILEFEKVKEDIEKFIDLRYIKLLHANDSKTTIGSRIDRHQHIGKGKIGIKGFEEIIKDQYFGNLPFIIETPKLSLKDDERNIKILRKIGEKYGKV